MARFLRSCFIALCTPFMAGEFRHPGEMAQGVMTYHLVIRETRYTGKGQPVRADGIRCAGQHLLVVLLRTRIVGGERWTRMATTDVRGAARSA
jgi:hypothetical protein